MQKPTAAHTVGDERVQDVVVSCVSAADQLIARHGLSAFLDYFRLFTVSDNTLANFRTAFQEECHTFEVEFQTNLTRLLE
jgi:hypothetical protein